MTLRPPRVACLVALLLVFLAEAPRTRADERPFGVNEDLLINDPPADVPALVAAMREAGIQIVRVPFRWYAIEPSRGQFVFSRYDAVVAAVRSAGIDVLGIPSDPPTWANGISGPLRGIYPPIGDADWADFVFRVAEHYRGQVFAWELWNEENIQQFFGPNPDPVRYVALLKTGYTAVRAASPGAIVVLGGLAGNGVDMGLPGESRNFLQAIYANGGKGYFDVAAIHPYVHPIGQGFSFLQARVRDARAVLAANGEPAKPMWLTEVGWPTAPPSGPLTNPLITEADAASWVRTIYQRRTELGVDKIFWYNLRDVGSDPSNPENHNGLLRADLSRKPSFLAYRDVTGAAVAQAPGTPTNLAASASGAAVTITWNAPTGVAPDSYTMEVGSAPGLSDLAIVSTTTTTVAASGVASGTYYLRVRARNASGVSAPSNEVALVVGSSGCGGAPGAPIDLHALTGTNGSVMLAWTAAAGNPTSYVIEAGSSPGARDLAIVNVPGAPPAFTASGVPRGTYYVRVRGQNGCGAGAASNEVRVDVSS